MIRNICAHHARLWNRVLGIKPLIPNKDPRWNKPVPIPNDRVFAALTICRHCLGIIAPGSEWTDRFKELLDSYPDIPRAGLGLIADWDKHPLWS
jgi:abortive infection bacteriophage resistance protein